MPPSDISASSGDGERGPASTIPEAWAFTDLLAEGVYGIDSQGLCTFVNAAALRILGYAAADDLLGRHMHQMIHHTRLDGSPFPAAACPLLHTMTSGRAVRLDNELLWREDGTSFIAEYSSFPVPGVSPGETGGIITFIDRSPSIDASGADTLRQIQEMWGSAERRRTEDALRESEAKFRTLADSIPQLAWMTDADGAIHWYNKRWYDYTGMSLADTQGWNWKEVHHPDHRERVIAHITEAFAEKIAWEDTFPLRGKDGTFRWFLSRALPIRDAPDDEHPDGRLLGWFGTNTDVTDLREAEERIAAARDAAEEANQAKSAFIANMSHELRTPLSAIIGYSEMLTEEIADGGDPTALAEDMRKIEGNARHLLGLINDVLDLSKIESGRMELYAETFGVEEMVRDVAATVQGLVDKKTNHLVLQLAPDLGEMVSDVTKIRQVLLNLLSNAAKFTEGGVITLSAARLPSTAPDPGKDGSDWLMFRVADTGIGMSPEHLSRLFQRFQQADASTTRKFGGTGLGLSISKAFGTMLGGDLSVQSSPDEGSTFTVFLPASMPEQGIDGQAAPAAAAGVGPTAAPRREGQTAAAKEMVLVIDDDPAQRDLMTRFLGREGFGACTAADGYAGLQMARELRPRAILLDVTMPGLDGWSVLSALKADPAASEIPVIMITFLDERSLAASLGAADYVMKPVKWDNFRHVMDRFRNAEGDVLVVDDDEDTRLHIRSVLEKESWVVTEAPNGREALSAVARSKPRVILLDLEMPVMDGFAFLKALREVPGCHTVPVVVLTARDLTREDRRRLQGASEILIKGETSLATLAKQLRALTEAVAR